MSYHIVYIPQVHDRSKQKKGYGGVDGRSAGHNRYFNDKGVFYVDGMGCSRHHNCFTCPLPDCIFQSVSQDAYFFTNRGNGIKVW